MEQRKRAVIYTRISRDHSGEGKSNQRQEDLCRAYCQFRDYEVTYVENDVSISAYTGKRRPGWDRVKDHMIEGRVDVVIAWKLDRVTRTLRELSDIILLSRETGVPIATTEAEFDLSNEAGKAMASFIGVISEWEVERKGARQKAANAQRRAEGARWASGWRPFGYELNGAVIPSEAHMIEQAALDVLDGTSLREIARRWQESGVSTPRSSKGAAGWTHHGVRSILLNPRNAGLNTYRGKIVGAGNWEAILTEQTHVRLVALLTDKSRKSNGANGRMPANLLSGLATCAVCDAPVVGGTVGRTAVVDGARVSTGKRVPVYKCPNEHLSTNREEADGIVEYAFQMSVMFDVQGAQLLPRVSRADDSQTLHEEAQRLTDEIKALATSFAEGRITLPQMEIATHTLREKLAAVEKDLTNGPLDSKSARKLLLDNIKGFTSLSTSAKRELLSKCARIKLYPKGRGKKNVPIKHQVTMDLVTYRRDGSERLIPALRERPPDLPPVNVTTQTRTRAR